MAATVTDEEARASLERAADELFYRNGINAVSMAQIRDLSGVSFRRLYSVCPSKSDLIALWLRHRHDEWTKEFSTTVETKIADGSSVVDAIFEALAAWMAATDFRGCGFINTHAECGELTDEHRRIIEDHKRGLASYLQALLDRSSSGTDHNSPDRGASLSVLVDGAIVQASIFASTEPIHRAHEAAAKLTMS